MSSGRLPDSGKKFASIYSAELGRTAGESALHTIRYSQQRRTMSNPLAIYRVHSKADSSTNGDILIENKSMTCQDGESLGGVD